MTVPPTNQGDAPFHQTQATSSIAAEETTLGKMPEFPALDKGEWVVQNYDALLAAMRRDDVYAVTGYKAIGLEVQAVVPDKGPDSAQQHYQKLRDNLRNNRTKKGNNTTRDKTASNNGRGGERKKDDGSKKGNNVAWDKETREDSLTEAGQEDDNSTARAKWLANYIMSTTDIYD